MKTLAPLSAVAADADYIASAANFPALKRHWPFTYNAAAPADFVDDIVGTILRSNSVPSVPTATTYGSVPNATAGTIAGVALPTIGANDFLFLVVGKFSAAGFQLGASGAGNPRVHVNQAAGSIYDGFIPLAGTAFTNSGFVYGRAIGIKDWDNATGQVEYQADTGSVASALAATSSAGVATLPAFSAGWVSSAAEILKAELWVFAGNIPTDMLNMIAWTVAAANQGIKDPYPLWRNVA